MDKKIDYYFECFDNLRGDGNKGGFPQNKLIMLLSVISLFENGFENNKIHKNELIIPFKKIWKECTGEEMTHSDSFFHPFIRLSWDENCKNLWKLFDNNRELSIHAENKKEQFKLSKNKAQFVFIDDKNFVDLLKNQKENRIRLKNYLLHKLKKESSLFKNYQQSENGLLLGDVEEDITFIEKKNTTELYVQNDTHKFAPSDAHDMLDFNGSGPETSPAVLEANLQKMKEIGDLGEKLINDYFNLLCSQNKIRGYEWVSQDKQNSPYDFRVTDNDGVETLLDVKSTRSDFTAPVYISKNEFETMTHDKRGYDLYRVYDLDEHGGKLRIAEGMRDFAKSVLDDITDLPCGAKIISATFAVDTKKIENLFCKEIAEIYFSVDKEK